MEQKPPKEIHLPEKDHPPIRHSVDKVQPMYTNSSNHVGLPKIVVGTPPSRNSPIIPPKDTHHIVIDRTPKTEDSGIYVNYSGDPKVDNNQLYQNMPKGNKTETPAKDMPIPSQVCRPDPCVFVCVSISWKKPISSSLGCSEDSRNISVVIMFGIITSFFYSRQPTCRISSSLLLLCSLLAVWNWSSVVVLLSPRFKTAMPVPWIKCVTYSSACTPIRGWHSKWWSELSFCAISSFDKFVSLS